MKMIVRQSDKMTPVRKSDEVIPHWSGKATFTVEESVKR